jgi:RimJ/RimL family protein N-acetyltransferase
MNAQEAPEERVVFPVGRKVRLRPLNKNADLEPCLRGMNDPEIIKFLLTPGITSRAEEEEWFDNLKNQKNDIVLGIELLENGLFIGTIGLHKIDRIMRTAFTGTAIFDPAQFGKGYGTDAKMVLLQYAFHTLGLHYIESAVIEYNERSWRYSLKCGYKVEGRKREAVFKLGRRWDLVCLGLLRRDWEPIWERY